MHFTKEQFKVLEQFEKHFKTAVSSNWSRNPGAAGLQVIHSIFTTATGEKIRLNVSCGQCILNLIRDCGKLYFKDKEERTKEDAKKVVVEVSEEENANHPKTPQNGVKTPRRANTRKKFSGAPKSK